MTKVLIIGAGIGGLGAAIALGRRGVDVDVVELRENSGVLGVGINQPANSLRALRALGVLDEVLAAGFPYDRNSFYDWQGRLVVDCPSALGGDVPANTALSRSDLHRILIGAVEKAGVKVTHGTTLHDLHDTGDHVDVTLTDGKAETYDLVIGFDGQRSPLRRRLFGTEHEPVFTGYSVWRLTMPRPAEVTHTMLFQGDGTKAGVIPLSDDSMYLLHVTAEPGNPHIPADGMAEMLAERLAGYGGLIGELRDSVSGADGIVYSPLSEVLLPSPWFKGRTIVLGDAAHACAPHLTQGAGMALEDAVVLAEELSPTGRAVGASLQAFMERRCQRVKLVQDVSHQILFGEMAVTTETLPAAVAHMRETLPGQLRQVENFLNQAFWAAGP
ncbi:FAD-dependent monooxygenase [Streptomyces muensis]|uniref:FAD-dependent monooxygenase n=1 Tax=Streptomyces muensis TaxID=1077944 RepID=A0A9X1PSH9_STRM4|nr:FAD-dependent monooxygenase [Streptomyces muensis]MCF1592298.1 FAD-dependent monooxygenase [Streptomyces muensis]